MSSEGSSQTADFDKLEAMLKMVPLRLLKCARCGCTGKEDFELVYTIRFRAPLDFDGPSKIVTPDYGSEDFDELLGAPQIRCVKCGHEFPLPSEWRIVQQRNQPQRPGFFRLARGKKPIDYVNDTMIDYVNETITRRKE